MFLSSFEDSVSPQIAGLGRSWADADCLVRLLDVESDGVCFRVNRLPDRQDAISFSGINAKIRYNG